MIYRRGKTDTEKDEGIYGRLEMPKKNRIERNDGREREAEGERLIEKYYREGWK